MIPFSTFVTRSAQLALSPIVLQLLELVLYDDFQNKNGNDDFQNKNDKDDDFQNKNGNDDDFQNKNGKDDENTSGTGVPFSYTPWHGSSPS